MTKSKLTFSRNQKRLVAEIRQTEILLSDNMHGGFQACCSIDVKRSSLSTKDGEDKSAVTIMFHPAQGASPSVTAIMDHPTAKQVAAGLIACLLDNPSLSEHDRQNLLVEVLSTASQGNE